MATAPSVLTQNPITREKLYAALGRDSHEVVRAIEALLEDVGNTVPTAVGDAAQAAEDALDDAAAALAAAQAAQAQANTALATALAARLPVGAIHVTVDPANPATTLGYGTWARIGQGRVLVGVDESDPDFDTVEETGGSKTT